MKNIEQIKSICGIILLSFTVIGGFIFFLDSFLPKGVFLFPGKISYVFLSSSNGGSSNAPIFLGLCGIAGAYLLCTVKVPNS